MANMQELEKILEEIEEATRQEDAPIYCGDMEVDGYVRTSVVKEIIRKHMNDGWILVEERLPEDVYTPSELYEKQFLVTTPFGEERVVQRARCVPTGYVWFDGYDSVRVSVWRYIEPYRPERSKDGQTD